MSNTDTKEIVENTMVMTGAWSSYTCELSNEAKAAFKIALGDLRGVNYTPVAFAQQVVAGMYYSFFCNAKVVYPGAPNEAALILVFQPLKGDAVIKEIQPIKH